MQVESSATPLLTEDKASSLPGQFCPFHSRSTLELVEKAQGFCYVCCPERIFFIWIFHVDRPANIAWYQGAALVFTSATGHNIPSLWGDKGDI